MLAVDGLEQGCQAVNLPMLSVEGIERVSDSKSAHVSLGGDRKWCQAVNLPILAWEGIEKGVRQ
jgi:hypothetical protein